MESVFLLEGLARRVRASRTYLTFLIVFLGLAAGGLYARDAREMYEFLNNEKLGSHAAALALRVRLPAGSFWRYDSQDLSALPGFDRQPLSVQERILWRAAELCHEEAAAETGPDRAVCYWLAAAYDSQYLDWLAAARKLPIYATLPARYQSDYETRRRNVLYFRSDAYYESGFAESTIDALEEAAREPIDARWVPLWSKALVGDTLRSYVFPDILGSVLVGLNHRPLAGPFGQKELPPDCDVATSRVCCDHLANFSQALLSYLTDPSVPEYGRWKKHQSAIQATLAVANYLLSNAPPPPPAVGASGVEESAPSSSVFLEASARSSR